MVVGSRDGHVWTFRRGSVRLIEVAVALAVGAKVEGHSALILEVSVGLGMYVLTDARQRRCVSRYVGL